MKKIILLLIIFHTINCPFTNKFLLKPSRVKGIEAKEILNNRLASLFVNDISTGSNTSLAYDFLIPTLAGIDENKIYKRQEVESCATRIFLAAIAIDQPNIMANRTKKTSDPVKTSDPNSRLFPPLICQLKNVDTILDID